MATRVVFYSVTGHSRAVAEGASEALKVPLYALTDRFSSQFPGWKRASRKAARSFDAGVLTTAGVSFDRGERLVVVFPCWNGPIVPAVSGFIRSVSLEGVEVFLIVTRHLRGGDDLLAQLQDDIVQQGGSVGGVFSIRTLWRKQGRLRSLGVRLGEHVAHEPAGAPFSLQELLGDAIEDEIEARSRYLRLVEMTPDKRLKASFGSSAASEATHDQMIQEIYRVYAGSVYTPRRDPVAPLEPERVLNYAAFLEELGAMAEAEHKAEAGYRAIAARYSSQSDVVYLARTLAGSELRHFQDVKRKYDHLSHRHPRS